MNILKSEKQEIEEEFMSLAYFKLFELNLHIRAWYFTDRLFRAIFAGRLSDK